MNTALVAIAILISSLVANPSALADQTYPFCTSYFSDMLQKDVPYCLDRLHPDTPMLKGEAVAYYMHGTHGSAQSWFKNNYSNSLYWLNHHEADSDDQNIKQANMTFVSFNTSALSFFSDKPGDLSSPYESWFIKEFIPYIETTYGVCSEQKCRNLIGQSMGGFGALKTSFKYPKMFHAVAVNSPALPPYNIWVRERTWAMYFSRWGRVTPMIGFFLIRVIREIMPTAEDFAANNPIDLAANLPADQFPKLYFDMGGRDKYGFEEGYEILAETLDDRKIPYQTVYEPHAHHDMWKRHASDAIQFLIDQQFQTQPAVQQ